MSWGFDYFELEASDFAMDLDDLVVLLHGTAREGLKPLHNERVRQATEHLRSTGREEDADLAFQVEGWEEERAAERERILGGLMIAYLVLTLLTKLSHLKGYFDKTHPPSTNYEGKSKLDKLVNEYRQRFGVDMEASPLAFTQIRELVLARNSVMHSDGWPDDEYKAQFPGQRFVDEMGKINLSEKQFAEAVEGLKEFVRWLVDQLIPLRKMGGAVGS